MARFIKSSSQLTPKIVWNTLEPWDDCPWVVLGNVYASVNFTGNTSWESIAHFLHKKGQNNFAVLTGRHGDQLGQQVVSGKFVNRDPNSQADSAIDPEGDKKTATRLKSSNPNIDILVKDVGCGNHNTLKLITDEIKTQLGANRIVILAWCYSLYAQKEGWDVAVKNQLPTAFHGSDMVPISFTAKDWAWTSTYGKCAASVAAEQAAIS